MSTPVKFKELTLRNFMSYGNNDTTINLDFNEPILIIGKNHDAIVNGQIDSNGAGKSAILDALAYALYDKTISNKEKSNLINNINKKNLEVTLTFEKDGVTYKIIRMRKSKTKADVQFLVSNKDQEFVDKTPDSIANTNKEVERIIGLPFDVFSRIIVFSASFQPFLDLPSRHANKASQTSIMEELFGYTELTDKAEALKEKIKGVKGEFSHLQDLQEQVKQEKERHAKQLSDVSERLQSWDVEHRDKIFDKSAKLEELRKIDLDSERTIQEKLKKIREDIGTLESDNRVVESEKKSLEHQRDTQTAQIARLKKARETVELIESKIDFDKQLKIIESIVEKESDVKEQYDFVKYYTSQVEENKATDIELQRELETLKSNKCPYCSQAMHDAEERIKNLHPTLVELGNVITENEAKRDEAASKLAAAEDNVEKLTKKSIFKGSMGEYNKVRDQYRDNKALLESSEESNGVDLDLAIESKESDIISIREKISIKRTELKTMQDSTDFDSASAIERIVVNIENLENTLEGLKKESNPHKATFDDLNNVEFKNDHAEKLNDLDVELRHQEFLLKLLTKKDSFVRKNLLDRSLPFLNKRLMIYLEKLGLPHRVEFQPDMSAKISQFGTELDFSSLSSGQRARVNLALAFAFRDVLQARHGKISFCMLDECLDTGLGNVGVQLAAKMINEIATEDGMSMFIISHRDEIASMFKNQMVVELENGFSRIDQAA
jgi:DNA repair exonuclease SbcCD ATPase subunit